MGKKKSLNNIYYHLPVWLQNVLISAYGLYINQIRHGKKFHQALEKVESNLALSSVEFDQYLVDQLRDLVGLAKAHVPYYRERFKEIEPQQFQTLADIEKLPLLEKQSIRENPLDLVDEREDPEKLHVIHTTGTTGTPLNIYCTAEARKLNYAFFSRYLHQVGVTYKDSRVTIGGRIVVPSWQERPPFWRNSYFQKNHLFSSYHLSDKWLPFYIDQLKSIKPSYIDSYPSSVYTIAKYADDHDNSLSGITEAVVTSAETLYENQRALIEKQFDCRVYDQYGAAEMCVFIAQCEHGSYHVHSDCAIVEFLDENAKPAAAGEEAEVVCTGLVNRTMPLIRYRIGDKVVVGDNNCKCGSHFPTVERVIGRCDDYILTPEGNKIGRLSPVLKGFPVKEAQYRQSIVEEVDVLLVKDVGYGETTENEIVNELAKRLGNKIIINVKYVDKIERSKGMKLKSIVSNLK
ncbi:MAG: hypothetical protein N0C83_01305 [Candidatus Thiodiazotropha lotti]|nr:hypothetical protein [Candidatus Thiodiazotropha lotti]MCG8002482.1 hypothetical protein [Candidatus Thiodiazotropha lotti]MCW4186101.1 hypothetical protein [Candidatus Thiodiazotropha lotti]MCW4197922.1 hypothetical protein [Candidatus Thiodiazotropha lotti]